MNFLPIVTQAEYRGDYRIHVTFHDGIEKTTDFTSWLDGPVFGQLEELDYSQRCERRRGRPPDMAIPRTQFPLTMAYGAME